MIGPTSINISNENQISLCTINSNIYAEIKCKRDDTFNIVASNIVNWRVLGRWLDIGDIEISRIGRDQEICHDPKLITLRILKQSEEVFGDQFPQRLHAALENSGRKDILKKLRELNL